MDVFPGRGLPVPSAPTVSPRRSWPVARLGPPRDLVVRARWIFLAFSIASAVLVAGGVAGQRGDHRAAGAVAAVAAASLIGGWLREYRRGASMGVAIAEAAVACAAGIAVDSGLAVLVFLYARLSARALEGTALRSALLTGAYLAAFVVALAATPSHGATTVLEGVALGSGFLLCAPVMLLLGRTLTEVSQTRERAVEEAGRAERERGFQLLFEAHPEPLWVCDPESRAVLAANDAAVRIYGYSREELRLMAIDEMVVPLAADPSAPAADAHGPEYRHHRLRDGSIIAVEVAETLVEVGDSPRLLMLARDVTKHRALELQLRHQAMHDALTGLPNRTLLGDRVRTALRRKGWSGGGMPVMLVLDLDGFKAINDRLGHAAGDLLIAAAGDRLLECLRPQDTCARLGGDEFAVLLDGVETVEQARGIARRIEAALAEPFLVDGRAAMITCSIGVAPARPEHRSMDHMLQDADAAMYVAKAKGRACHAVFEPAFHAAMLDRARMHDDLRTALEAGGLRLVYQPQLAVASGRIATLEALLRWDRPGRGPVPPDEFIPVAEESGLISLVTEWVLREACAQVRRWERAGLGDLRVAVNISGRDLDGFDLADQVTAALAAAGLEPWQLELELTEGAVVQQQPRAVERLHALRAIGIGIAIDDFGTGYSVLSRLRDLPIDRLKIDRSFVSNITSDDASAAIVRATIDMGRELGLTIVAEGVEDAAALAWLTARGCDLVQGYHLARPLPADEVTRWLAERLGAVEVGAPA